MIDRATADALDRLGRRSDDLTQAYRPGATAWSADVAASSTPVPNLDPLSVAAPEGSFFVTRSPGGSPWYTRDGGFAFRNGALVDRDGAAVLGVAAGDAGGRLVPLRADSVDAALGRVSGERIASDGTVSYTRDLVDPRTGARRRDDVTIGRIALARFPAGTAPVRLDRTHVEAPHAVAPTIGAPGHGGFGTLATFARDVGGIDLVAGLQRLQEAYQAFEAMRAAHAVRGAVDKTTMDLVK